MTTTPRRPPEPEGADHALTRLEELFRQAIELPAAERAAFVERTCEDEASLRRRLLDLLVAHERPSGVLDTPAVVGRPAPDLQPGSQVGRYRLTGLIATGGMGSVYEAEQDSPRRTVALKLMHPGLARPSLLRRFELEAQLLGRLQHPGIAQIFEAGTADTGHGPQPYFAMERILGLPLVEHARSAGLDRRARLELLAGICDAVHHAHCHGVIHRDLKPANILVDQSGQPKVLDFGVARATDADVAAVTRATEAGQLLGTLPYMSPEQVAGNPEQLDFRSDVYSLGVLGYELLTGRLPYELDGRSLPEVGRLIRDVEPAAPSACDRSLRGDVETILLKALEKVPGRRYPSCAELAADIRRHLAYEPIVARPASTVDHLARFTRRHRVLVGAMAAIVAILLGAVIVSLDFAWDEAQARQLAESRRTEALREAVRADRRFRQVHELANVFIYDVYDSLRDVEGALAARELLVATAREYLDSLVEEAGVDVGLLADLAGAYARLGEVQGLQGGAIVGDSAAAIENLERAVQLRLALSSLRGGATEDLASLAAGLMVLGELRVGSGAIEQGLADLDLAHSVQLQVVERVASDRGALRNLAIAIDKRGAAEALHGDPLQALAARRFALDLFEALAAGEDAAASSRADVVAATSGVVDLLVAQREPEARGEALALLKRSLCQAEQLTLEDPTHAGHRRHRALLLLRAGDLAASAGDSLGALARYGELLSSVRQQLEVEPGNATLVRDLGVAHDKLALTRQGLGDLPEALEHVLAALALREERLEREPGHAQAMRDLAVSHYQAGRLQEAMAERAEEAVAERIAFLDEALSAYGRCLELNLEMQAHGVLRASDAPILDLLPRMQAGCEERRGAREDGSGRNLTRPVARPAAVSTMLDHGLPCHPIGD